MPITDMYTSDQYLKKNPSWHVNDSPWKAGSILRLIRKNNLQPASVCEIGCGAGEILRLLQQELDPHCTFLGYDIAPHAIALAKERENERLHFKLGDFNEEERGHFDLLLIIDVFSHIENAFRYLRDIKPKSDYKIFQFGLNVSVSAVLRNALLEYRQTAGHLHFLTKDIALEVLRDSGYEILDSFYSYQDVPWVTWQDLKGKTLRTPRYLYWQLKHLLYVAPRKMLYSINQDFAVRLFGGWRFVVLVK